MEYEARTDPAADVTKIGALSWDLQLFLMFHCNPNHPGSQRDVANDSDMTEFFCFLYVNQYMAEKEIGDELSACLCHDSQPCSTPPHGL